MKSINFCSFLLLILFMAGASLYSQERFPTRRLSSDSTREGFPSWSPDGKTIVYSFFNIIDGQPVHGSQKVSADGGVPVLFTDFPTEHPQWSPDGRFIVFDADTGASIRMIKAEGGSPVKFLPDSIGIHSGGLPCWSPDGENIAFKSGITFSLYVYNLRTEKVAGIFHEEGLLPIPGCWSPDGNWIFTALLDRTSRKSTMWKISPDGKKRQQITGHHDGFYRYLAVSPDGELLVYAALEEKKLGLWIMPAGGGKSLALAISREDHYEAPAWSPDGKRLAFASSRTGRGDIYIMEIDTGKVKEDLKQLNR